MGTEWDIRTEAVEDGLTFDTKGGPTGTANGTRIRFRRAGSRGRFESFVVVGKTAADLAGHLEEVVREYVAKKREPFTDPPLTDTGHLR